MIFDIILIITLIYTIRKAGKKECTEDLNFVLGSMVMMRIAGTFYDPVSGLLGKFISNRSGSIYAAYVLVFLVVFYIYTSYIGKKILEMGKRIPRVTGGIITYISVIFKTIIIYSMIFTILYTIPVLHKLPENLIRPKTYNLTHGILGDGTEDVFKQLSVDLSKLKNPVDAMKRNKQKQNSGTIKQFNEADKILQNAGDVKEDN